MLIRAVLRLLFAAMGAMAGVPSLAQDARTYVHWEAAPSAIQTGGRAEITLRAIIAPGWKLYALASAPPAPALRVTIDTVGTGGAAGVEIDGMPSHVRAPVAVFDSLLGVPVEQVSGETEVRVPLRIGAAAPGRVALAVRFAVCDASICLPPRTVRVVATLGAPGTPSEEAGGKRAAAHVLPPGPRPPALLPDSADARIGPATPRIALVTGATGAPPMPAGGPAAASESVPTEDSPRVPRLILSVLVGAALLRALLFALQRRSGRSASGIPGGRDDQNGAGSMLENRPRDAA